MRRAAPLPLALALALAVAACSDASGEDCPGDPVASLAFSGARIAAGAPALVGLDPVPAVLDCQPDLPDFPVAETLPPFRATLSADAFTPAAALCRPGQPTLHGVRAGARFTVETRTGGAVLPPACNAALRLVVAGDVLGGTGADPATFQGVLVEVLTRVDGDCSTHLPEPLYACAARYALQGAP